MTDKRVDLPLVLDSPSEKGCPLTNKIHSASTITSYLEPAFAEEPVLGGSMVHFK